MARLAALKAALPDVVTETVQLAVAIDKAFGLAAKDLVVWTGTVI